MKRLSGFFKRVWRVPLQRILTLWVIMLMAIVLITSSTVFAEPGDLLWEYPTGNWGEAVPTIGNDGTIYLNSLSDTGQLSAINPDGTLKWQYKTDDWGLYLSSPAIGNDGTIYAGMSEGLHAINPDDGTLKWKYEAWLSSYSSPTIASDGTIYIGGYSCIYAINPDGTLKWEYQTEGSGYISSTVIGTDGTIYFGSWDTYLYALKPDGTLKWSFKTGNTIYSSPVIGNNGTIYIGSEDQFLYAITPDGAEKWKIQTGEAIIFSPVIGSDDTIYLNCNDGFLYAISSDGTQKWQTQPQFLYSMPAIGSDDTIYTGTWDAFYALHPDDGSVKWEVKTNYEWIIAIAVGDDGILYARSWSGTIYAVEGGTFTCTPGEPGDISVSPDTGDFGDIFLEYDSFPMKFTIHNAGIGCDGLTINAVSISGADSSDFILQNNTCSGVLDAKRRCSAEVIFSPKNEGEKNAVLTIYSNDPDTPTTTISLFGDAKDPDSLELECGSPVTGEVFTPTIISRGDGNWNDPNTWDMNRVPDENDIILVRHHKITNLPAVVTVNTLCNYGELISLPDASLEIRASGTISNYVIGTIRGQNGADDPTLVTSEECANSGKDVILKTATNIKQYNKLGDWWWEATDAGPIYNDGQIIAGDGEDGLCGGKGGDAILLGRNVTNDIHGIIRAGKGGNSSNAKGGKGGLTQIFGKLGGPGDLISRGSVIAGDGGTGNTGGDGGNLWFVSLPNVYIGMSRTSYLANSVKSLHHAGASGGSGGTNGWIQIEPNLISIGAGVDMKGGDITIFGGDDWVLDFSEAEDTIIEASGDITLAAGENSVIDLAGTGGTLFRAGGDVNLFADDIQLSEGVTIEAIAAAQNIGQSAGKILRNVTLSGACQITGHPGETIPIRIMLANGGPEADTYQLSTKDVQGAALNDPIEIEVPGLDSAEFDLDVTLSSTVGDTDLITVTVVSTSDPETISEARVKVLVKSFSYFVDEHTETGVSIGKVSISGTEPGTTTYSIIEGNDKHIFEINSQTGEITINDSTQLDYETVASYPLTIQASDGIITKKTEVLVSLNNQNDTPVINDQNFSINENSPDNAVVGTVIASDDENDALTYLIIAGNEENIFNINGGTGEITVRNGNLLNYEIKESYLMTIQVSDGISSDTALITVNVNDLNEMPLINAQKLYLGKDSPDRTLVGTVIASDEDNDLLTYSIIEGNENNGFAISNTGEITVNNASQLDYDATEPYLLTVQVSDEEYAPTALITVEINNIPVISDTKLLFDEHLTFGTVIYQPNVYDADNDPLTYSIIAGNEKNAFSINPDTGVIKITDSTYLDYEIAQTYPLTIQVSDGKLSAEAVVTINLNNVNDNIPVIYDQKFFVDENSPDGTVIGKVRASDSDSDIETFRIKEGNENGVFDIMPLTGELFVKDGTLLDYEAKPSYALTVRVFDGEFEHIDMAVITVNLKNLNDNAPVIKDQVFSVPENSQQGATVARIKVSDADNDSLVFSIIEGNTENAFTVTPDTGEIILNNADLLVFGKTFIFTVQVSDGTYTDTGMIIVNITAPAIPGDLDGNGVVELTDAVIILKILTGTDVQGNFALLGADVNGDGRIGMEDMIYILRMVSQSID